MRSGQEKYTQGWREIQLFRKPKSDALLQLRARKGLWLLKNGFSSSTIQVLQRNVGQVDWLKRTEITFSDTFICKQVALSTEDSAAKLLYLAQKLNVEFASTVYFIEFNIINSRHLLLCLLPPVPANFPLPRADSVEGAVMQPYCFEVRLVLLIPLWAHSCQTLPDPTGLEIVKISSASSCWSATSCINSLTWPMSL